MTHLIDCTSCGGSGLDSVKNNSGAFVAYTGLSGFTEKCGTCIGLKRIPGPVQMIDNVSGPMARMGESMARGAAEFEANFVDLEAKRAPVIDPQYPTAVQAFLQSCLCYSVGDYDTDAVKAADFTVYGGRTTVEIGGDEWLVMDAIDADAAAEEQIWDSVWAFNVEFLHTHIPGRCLDAVRALQGKSEDGVEGIQALIQAGSGKDRFIQDAVNSNGRGRFLAGCAHNEHELVWNGKAAAFYAYRTN